MSEYIQTQYPDLLNYSFLGSFLFLFLWEQFSNWVKLRSSPSIRWWNTIALYLLSRYMVLWLLSISIISAAFYAETHSIGLLNLIALNETLAIVIGFLAYDFINYAFHWLLHKYPLLWRLHLVHHSDTDVDIITDLRHHPLESLVTALFLMAFVFVFGISPMVVILRTLVTLGVSLFSHANVRIPEKIDRILRLVIITPAMHRVHHSSYQPETDSNYGALFSFWDRLCGTYVEKPKLGFQGMQLGLHSFRSERDQWLDRLLLQPFRSDQDDRDSVTSAEKNEVTR